jgi:hypothetical protein
MPRTAGNRWLTPERRRRRDGLHLRRVFEQLEGRWLLSAQPPAPTPWVLADPTAGATSFASASPPDGALTPSQIREAYGFDQIAFGGIPGDGTGQTIAIIDPYDSPTIAADLQTFDTSYGLPAPPSFTRIAQDGSTNYPPTDPAGAGNHTWELETSLDVEWAHALVPNANLLLVEANSWAFLRIRLDGSAWDASLLGSWRSPTAGRCATARGGTILIRHRRPNPRRHPGSRPSKKKKTLTKK